MAGERQVCSKCGRDRPVKEYYKLKTGNYCEMCKDCLTMYIDNKDPQTFLWILEMFDVPYIESKWIEQCNNIYRKKGQLGPKSVIGTYIRTMNMTQYKEYHYSDTDKLNYAGRKAAQEKAASAEQDQLKDQELKEKLERGEITQAQYETMSPVTAASWEGQIIAPTQTNIPSYSQNDELLKQLSDEDYQYLSLKWGSVYRPDQWVTMETMYNKYANEYDINVDREEVLKKMCKTSLKMDESLDAGDVGSYKNLAAVFDQLRKSGKFTEAQNKEERTRYLDTIGELVRLCEEAKGPIIDTMPDPDEYPQDKIDFTIKDMKNYTYGLVANEPHMQTLIETFIEKYEKAMEAEADFEADLVLSPEDEEKQALTNDEAQEFQRFLENEIEADAAALLAEFGDYDES